MQKTIEHFPDSPRQTETLRDQVIGLISVEDNLEFAHLSSAFIDQQLEELSALSSPQNISLLSKSHEGFIHPDSIVKQAVFGKGFQLNDKDIYASLLVTMREFKDAPGWEDSLNDPQNYRKLALFSTQYALMKYFEQTSTDSDTASNRNVLIYEAVDINDEDSFKPRSIADYKGRALCAENAAVANNMLAMLGFETSYYIGELAVDDEKPDSHAFLVLKNANGVGLIYDPTHPEITSQGDARTLRPFLAVGGDDLANGETVTVGHNYTIVSGDETTKKISQYTYTPSPTMKHFKPA